MARHDHTERQHRQWLREAHKHLDRGNLEGLLPALLRLPPPLREELLPRGAALFRKAVQQEHSRGAWGPLSTLAARADTEPALVERGVEPEEAWASYWPLVWAAGHAHEWQRAQRLWQPLAEAVRARAPLLAAALESWLGAQGAPQPEALSPALERLRSVDSRLGVEPPRSRVSLPPPRSLAEVEGALLALRALEPFPVFASRAEAWARAAPAEVARAVWELAGLLAARELWIRAAEGKERAALSEPALLLARAVREGGAPQALSAPTLQALRVVAAGLAQAVVSRADEAEPLCALAQAAALQPAVEPWVLQAVSGIRFAGEALPRALGLYQAILARVVDAPLWARALLSWCAHNPQASSAPGWLQEGLGRLLATQASPLLSWLRGAAPSERKELTGCVASTCAPSLVESWVEACWQGADEELRHVLSEAILILLDRSRERQGERQLERELEQRLRGAQSVKDVERLFEEVERLLEEPVPPKAKLTADGLRTWRRFAPRVLPYRVEFLKEAVRHASSDTEAWEAAVRYLEAHPGNTGHMEALRALDLFGREALARRVLERLLERCAANVLALAEAAVAAGRVGISCKYLHPLLESFMLAMAEQPPSAQAEAVQQARALAGKHGFQLSKRKAARGKRASGTPARRAPRSKKKKPAAEDVAPPKEPEGSPQGNLFPPPSEGER
jgi:hypothetical protein